MTYTASLVKPLVVARLLALDRSGSVQLSGTDLALMERAVVASDDDAMNALWERYDGPRRVQEVAASMGMPETAPPVDRGRWGQATTTAADFAGFLSAFEDMLDLRDAEMLLGWMRSTTAVASDGFYQRFGLLATGSGPVAAKQGWMCCIDDRRRLH